MAEQKVGKGVALLEKKKVSWMAALWVGWTVETLDK